MPKNKIITPKKPKKMGLSSVLSWGLRHANTD